MVRLTRPKRKEGPRPGRNVPAPNYDAFDRYDSGISSPAPRGHIHHISELRELHELSQQASAASRTSDTVRLVRNSSDNAVNPADGPGVARFSTRSESQSVHQAPARESDLSGSTAVSSVPRTSHLSYPSTTVSPYPMQDSSASAQIMISSPSGQMLDLQTYLERPDRPLTIPERQERIRSETIRNISANWGAPGQMARPERRKGKKLRAYLGRMACWK